MQRLGYSIWSKVLVLQWTRINYMKLIKKTSLIVQLVNTLRSTVGSVLRIPLLLAVSLVGTLTAPALYASELQDNQAVLTQYMHTFQMDAWHIQLVMVDKKFLDTVMGNPNSVGASQLNYATKYGVIWVLRRSEYTPEVFKSFKMNDQDEEWVIVDQRNTVVHELLHMVWKYCNQEETCVSMIAEAIVPHEDTR